MIAPRVWIACFGGTLAAVTLLYGIIYQSVGAQHLLLILVPPLIVFIWWMVDRAALEHRIRSLEARTEIGDERRVTTQINLADVEHKLHEVEGRVADFEKLTSPANVTQGKVGSRETVNEARHMRLERAHKAIMVFPPVSSK
jgi:hypothetical protein